MRLGEIEVHPLVAGRFRLDGGAMFGVIPRVLWEKKMAPDDKNRISMVMNVLLINAGNKSILVDTGAGDKEDAKFHEIYALSHSLLEGALAARGLAPSDIDVVVNTHLHFDHAGGNTSRGEDGRIAPVFPNARYLVQRTEFDAAMAANERNKASYFAENYKPLYDEGRMELVSGQTEIAHGVAAEPLPGHTRGLQGLMLHSGGETGLYLADCVPTSHHIPLPWIMAYDLYPTETLATKKRILPEAARKGWTLFFEHDPDVQAAKIEQEPGGRFILHPVRDSE